MTTMFHKQIDIEPDQQLLLRQLADELGVHEAEIVRRAIEAYASHFHSTKQPDLRAWEAERSYILSRNALGSSVGGRNWRREALYD